MGNIRISHHFVHEYHGNVSSVYDPQTVNETKLIFSVILAVDMELQRWTHRKHK